MVQYYYNKIKDHKNNVVNLIKEFPEINIKKQEPLSKYTFTHTGGEADWLAFPENV